MRAAAILIALPLLAAGCENSCQTFCQTMADRSEACGVTWTEGDVSACQDVYATATGDELATCRDYGQPFTLERSWTCDDVLLYADLFDKR